jgi:hypothetical protein
LRTFARANVINNNCRLSIYSINRSNRTLIARLYWETSPNKTSYRIV